MPFYKIDNVTPVVDRSSYVHPSAVVIGDVIISKNCYIGPGASLRGDFGQILIDAGANVQDNCITHSYPNEVCHLKVNSHIGHGAILHGCTVGCDALVGMHSVIMDGAIIADRSMVAACSFVTAGFTSEEQSLIIGIPAKVKRRVTDEELQWKRIGTADYHSLVKRSTASLVEVIPLSEIDKNRPKIQAESKPKFKV